MADPLLPCIYCEGDAEVDFVPVAGVNHFYVRCTDCGDSTVLKPERIDAIDVWNGGPSHRQTIERIRFNKRRAAFPGGADF